MCKKKKKTFIFNGTLSILLNIKWVWIRTVSRNSLIQMHHLMTGPRIYGGSNMAAAIIDQESQERVKAADWPNGTFKPLLLGEALYLNVSPAPPQAASLQEPACHSCSGACKSTASVAQSEASGGSEWCLISYCSVRAAMRGQGVGRVPTTPAQALWSLRSQVRWDGTEMGNTTPRRVRCKRRGCDENGFVS